MRRWRRSPGVCVEVVASGARRGVGVGGGGEGVTATPLCRVRLNDFLLAFGHAELYFIIVVLDVLIHSALLRF